MKLGLIERDITTPDPSRRSWSTLIRVFGFREKLLIWSVLLVIFGAALYWAYSIYIHVTEPIPLHGGKYVEGMVGQPTYLNPLFSEVSEVDSDIAKLIYDGLLSYGKDGSVETNIAEEWDVSDDGKVYTMHLKQDVRWHDGEELLADDVVFTYKLIQNATYKSPLRFKWQGVEIQQSDEYTVVITLKDPYFGFIENLTVGILPKHVWENVAPDRFTLSSLNIEPIGCGPYMYIGMQKDGDGNILVYEMESFEGYHNGEAFIRDLIVQFYADKEALIDALKRKEVLGMNGIDALRSQEFREFEGMEHHEILIPHFFAVFFNQNRSVALAYDEVREALSLTVDRNELVEKAFFGHSEPAQSLFLRDSVGYKRNMLDDGVRIDDAKKLLDENGWSVGEEGIRKKDDIRLEFTLMVPDWPEAVETAHILEEQWLKIGAKMNISVVGVFELGQNYIQPREYDALLFANVTSLYGDPLVFWHSDQKKDPGRNFALFDNNEADGLLEKARITLDPNERGDIYGKWQDVLQQKDPAIYLFSPFYIYPVYSKVRGIDIGRIANPSDRFSYVEQWYVKTKRVLK